MRVWARGIKSEREARMRLLVDALHLLHLDGVEVGDAFVEGMVVVGHCAFGFFVIDRLECLVTLVVLVIDQLQIPTPLVPCKVVLTGGQQLLVPASCDLSSAVVAGLKSRAFLSSRTIWIQTARVFLIELTSWVPRYHPGCLCQFVVVLRPVVSSGLRGLVLGSPWWLPRAHLTGCSLALQHVCHRIAGDGSKVIDRAALVEDRIDLLDVLPPKMNRLSVTHHVALTAIILHMICFELLLILAVTSKTDQLLADHYFSVLIVDVPRTFSVHIRKLDGLSYLLAAQPILGFEDLLLLGLRKRNKSSPVLFVRLRRSTGLL